jgi:hypothetical protein
MANGNIGKEQGSTLRSAGNAGLFEPRLARLENDIEYVKRDVGELRTDMRDVRDRVMKIETDIDHLPTKAFVFGAFGVVTAFLTTITLFQSQIQHVIGFASGGH